MFFKKSTEEKKHVSFNEKPSETGSGMSTVESAVEKGKEAAGQVAHVVLKHIPGTPEHVVHTTMKELKETGKDIHVADGEKM